MRVEASSKRDVRFFSFFFLQTASRSTARKQPWPRCLTTRRDIDKGPGDRDRQQVDVFQFVRFRAEYYFITIRRFKTDSGRNLRGLARTKLDRAAIFTTLFFGPCLPNYTRDGHEEGRKNGDLFEQLNYVRGRDRAVRTTPFAKLQSFGIAQSDGEVTRHNC